VREESLRLERGFFERDPVVCARDLIGCKMICGRSVGRVIETEAYATLGDAACHTARRASTRAFLANHPAGSAYVYLTYGMHWMFNVLIKGDVEGFVLVRALEAESGSDEMVERRGGAVARNLCSGPGKLTQALGINLSHNGLDLCAAGSLGFLTRASPFTERIHAGPRIGISAAKTLPWRFLLEGAGVLKTDCNAGKVVAKRANAQ